GGQLLLERGECCKLFRRSGLEHGAAPIMGCAAMIPEPPARCKGLSGRRSR
ncbi:MAG: hypothetical protein ACI8RZ_007785, partial [Myxococcota bacterium]